MCGFRRLYRKDVGLGFGFERVGVGVCASVG